MDKRYTTDGVGLNVFGILDNGAIMTDEQIVDRLNELQAIVDRLPRTADGVPVVPGQTIFANWPLGPTVRCYAKHESHGPDMVVFGEGSTTIHGLTCGIRVFVSDCFSTREAAEASRKEPNGKD